MKELALQMITSLTATGLITFTVTHMHEPLITWSWWIVHWIVAWPIAFVTMRWIAPIYRRMIARWTS